MTHEIERKFLVAHPPALDLSAGVALRQGYVALDGDVEVRVRIRDGDAILTVKAGSGLTRTEVEVALAAGDAEALWPHTAGRRVEKRRFAVPVGPHLADVDVYAGALAGLCTAEVEFTDETSAAAFEPPSWFTRDVTGDPAWSNAALARFGLPR